MRNEREPFRTVVGDAGSRCSERCAFRADRRAAGAGSAVVRCTARPPSVERGERRPVGGHRIGEREGGTRIGPAIDRSLIDRARNGDLDAFESIVRARMDAVYRLTTAILGDEADARDATQETFVAAWRQLRSLRDPERLDAWLQRIAINAARMSIRSRSRRRVREIPASSVTSLAARRGSTGPDDAVLLDDALATLAVDQRAILVLHHLDGRTVAEVAAILGIPEGTAKSRLFHARRALAAALAAERER
jgi:RNA polymerase sigma-70 factor (ECF subfamily)